MLWTALILLMFTSLLAAAVPLLIVAMLRSARVEDQGTAAIKNILQKNISRWQ
jgi:hypothetical protein